jgi:hypothetical protein
MTERKPSDEGFESWVERQLREARERGDFDNLPGAGKPIPGLDQPYDDMWWVKDKLQRENLTYLPTTLALRKEAEAALEAVAQAKSETEVRRILADINGKLRAAIKTPPDGPPLNRTPFNVERVVREWRGQRSG